MKYLFIYCFITIGLVYIYRGVLILKKNRIHMMTGVSSLTPEEKKQMIPIIGPYYIVIGILFIIVPFSVPFIGNLGWYFVLGYIIIGTLTIAKKRNHLIHSTPTKNNDSYSKNDNL